MTPKDETLAHVCALLGKVPTVVVQAHSRNRSAARIEFSVQEVESVRALERAALGANVAIEPWTKGVFELPPGSYAFVASTNLRDGFKAGELQLLGIHLAWYLHKVGLLAAPQANALLKPWGAAQVGV